jgi:TrmH family RNA methyltransferase
MAKIYKNEVDFSYALGVFPTIELIRHKKQYIQRIMLKSDSKDSQGVKEIIGLCNKNDIPFEYNDRFIDKLSLKENCHAIGIFDKYASPIEQNKNHIVLVNPSDMGNLGTIIRTMIGFGVNNLAIIRPGCDIFSPKAIRSAMGASFIINFEYFDSFEEYQSKFKNSIYTFMLDGKKELHTTIFEKPFSLVFGNEGFGLDPKFQNYGTSITIKHSDQIDSLNLSIAVALSLYQASKI